MEEFDFHTTTLSHVRANPTRIWIRQSNNEKANEQQIISSIKYVMVEVWNKKWIDGHTINSAIATKTTHN